MPAGQPSPSILSVRKKTQCCIYCSLWYDRRVDLTVFCAGLGDTDIPLFSSSTHLRLLHRQLPSKKNSGYAFAFGGQNSTTATTFIGTKDFASVGGSASFWFFQYTFSATSVTIVAGTLAERCQMAAYLCYSVFLAGFVYPIVAHSVWSNNGFLSTANIEPLLNVSYQYFTICNCNVVDRIVVFWIWICVVRTEFSCEM